MIQNKYFDIYWENPLKTYNKIKKWFKPIYPNFQMYFGKRNKAKILELNSFDVTWKDKWNSPRHEFNPRILISLFNYIHFYIEWSLQEDSLNDTIYWESILDYIYYGKSLQEACSNGWSQLNPVNNQYEEIFLTILREPYQTSFKNNSLNNWYYESTKQ